MAFIEPLDLFRIFINYFFGSVELFIFGAYIAIPIVCAKFNVPSKAFLLIMGLFSIIFANYVGGVYIITLLVAGIFIFGGISKFFR